MERNQTVVISPRRSGRIKGANRIKDINRVRGTLRAANLNLSSSKSLSTTSASTSLASSGLASSGLASSGLASSGLSSSGLASSGLALPELALVPSEGVQTYDEGYTESSSYSNIKIRKIIHINMDNLYAAIEQRDNPSQLLGKPVVVGRTQLGERSVVCSVSQEGAHYGIHSSMPLKLAIAQCPHLIIVPPRFSVYQQVSQQILGILKEYSPFVEPLELVEAYIEVTESPKGMTSATLLAKEIKERILQSTGLICSVGVSTNKFVAKAASSLGKPDGLLVIPPKKVCAFLEQLPISNFNGISYTAAKRFFHLGVKTGLDLKRLSELELRQNFGKLGYFLFHLVRGKDNRSIIVNREQKSLYAGFTFINEEKMLNIIEGKLIELTELVTEKLNYLDRGAKCVVVKITNSLLATRSRQLSFATSTITHEDISRAARFCLLALVQPNELIHHIGVSLTNLAERPKYQQLSIFG